VDTLIELQKGVGRFQTREEDLYEKNKESISEQQLGLNIGIVHYPDSSSPSR
jgi:hypothetical protein